MSSGLHWIDGAVVAGYVFFVLALGWYYSRRQKDTEEYFTGGHAMSPLLIGISLFATLFSTISYLGTPGELINKGPITLLGMLSIPFAYFAVGYWIIPVYMRQRVTSAYELLEQQLGLSVRLIGAAMFVAMRLVWMSMLIYFASKAMVQMLELESRHVPYVAAISGTIAIIYSTLGGLRAVVITDLFQFLLLFSGAVMVIVIVTIELDGFVWVPTSWNPEWDTQPLFSWDPYVRATALGSIFHGMLWWVCTAGGDQTAIQRFMATRDAGAARRSFLINSVAGAAVSLVLAAVGFSLLGYYQANPQLLPEDQSLAVHADLVFPRFISHELPVGLSGLVISGMFAAAMSSLDSGVNSICAVVMTDFVDRFRKRPVSEQHRVRVAQAMAVAIGVIVISAVSYMDYVPGNFLEKTKRTLGLFVVPMFSLFFMAMFVPFATKLGAILGAIAGFCAAGIVAYGNVIFGDNPSVEDYWYLRILPDNLLNLGEWVFGEEAISYQLIFPAALAAAIGVGCTISGLQYLLKPRRNS